MILTSRILMVRPRGFTGNEETAADNFFQLRKSIEDHGLIERQFDNCVATLRKEGIDVVTYDPPDDDTPDAVFPNNWFSTFPSGELFIYPMRADNRRKERRPELIDELKKHYKTIEDLSPYENNNKFLEGTGSIVVDHSRKLAFVSLSKRADEELLENWSERTGYKCITFRSFDRDNLPVYHTNVVMTLGHDFAIICSDAISSVLDKNKVIATIKETGRDIIHISLEQMHQFCGNCIELQNNEGVKYLLMSETAFRAFTDRQLKRLLNSVKVICTDIGGIEETGGGSARCMVAELF
jgi:hypothetical protein